MSSVHSQCRLPSSPAWEARMFTTRSTSGNSKRCGTSASRSFGPIPGSSLIAEKIQSMMVRNSFGDENSAPMAQEDEEEPEDPVERVLAGFFAAVLRERVVVVFFAAVLRDRVVAGFFAAVLRELVVAGFFAAVLRELVVAGFFAAVLREREAAGFVAVRLLAVDREGALLETLPSSAATRARRPATSFLRSSRTFR